MENSLIDLQIPLFDGYFPKVNVLIKIRNSTIFNFFNFFNISMMLNKILIHWFTFNVTTRFQLIQPAAIQLVIRPYILLPIDIFNFIKLQFEQFEQIKSDEFSKNFSTKLWDPLRGVSVDQSLSGLVFCDPELKGVTPIPILSVSLEVEHHLNMSDCLKWNVKHCCCENMNL